MAAKSNPSVSFRLFSLTFLMSTGCAVLNTSPGYVSFSTAPAESVPNASSSAAVSDAGYVYFNGAQDTVTESHRATRKLPQPPPTNIKSTPVTVAADSATPTTKPTRSSVKRTFADSSANTPATAVRSAAARSDRDVSSLRESRIVEIAPPRIIRPAASRTTAQDSPAWREVTVVKPTEAAAEDTAADAGIHWKRASKVPVRPSPSTVTVIKAAPGMPEQNTSNESAPQPTAPFSASPVAVEDRPATASESDIVQVVARQPPRHSRIISEPQHPQHLQPVPMGMPFPVQSPCDCSPCEGVTLHTDQISNLFKRVNDLEGDLKRSDKSISVLEKSLTVANGEIVRLKKDVNYWQQELSRLESSVQKQHEDDIVALERVSEMLGLLIENAEAGVENQVSNELSADHGPPPPAEGTVDANAAAADAVFSADTAVKATGDLQ
ncbi:MAG: hypothetical protein R3C59_26575 [Planctomycetaceae bacterium]